MKIGFVKKLLHAIGDFFKGQFEWAKSHAEIAVEVVNKIKTDFVESPLAQLVVDLTPFKWDDELLVKIRAGMQAVSKEMMVAEGILAAANKDTDALVALAHYMQTKTKDARVKFWVEFAGKLTDYLSDGKLSNAEAIALSQLIYEQKYGKVEDVPVVDPGATVDAANGTPPDQNPPQ